MGITKETAIAIAVAHREIETSEKLLTDLASTMRESSIPDARDMFGRKREGLQLGVPSGNTSLTLFDVPSGLAKPIIEAHIAVQRQLLSELGRTASIELEGEAIFFPKALTDVVAERRRQIDAEGWSPEHDDKHTRGEMVVAAMNYAAATSVTTVLEGAKFKSEPPLSDWPLFTWPWDRSWWKPGKPRRMLVKAAALILAEIERLDRMAKRGED